MHSYKSFKRGFRSLRHWVPTTATIPVRRENFCPVADGVEKIKAVSRRPYRNLGAKARDEHDDNPHRTDVSQSEQQDSPGGGRQATQLACGHPSSHSPSQEDADEQRKQGHQQLDTLELHQPE